MLAEDDVGHRVVVRRVVGTRDGRPLLTDTLGTLTGWEDQQLTVTTEAGPVTITHADIVAAKRIPPKPPRRSPRRGPG